MFRRFLISCALIVWVVLFPGFWYGAANPVNEGLFYELWGWASFAGWLLIGSILLSSARNNWD